MIVFCMFAMFVQLWRSEKRQVLCCHVSYPSIAMQMQSLVRLLSSYDYHHCLSLEEAHGPKHGAPHKKNAKLALTMA